MYRLKRKHQIANSNKWWNRPTLLPKEFTSPNFNSINTCKMSARLTLRTIIIWSNCTPTVLRRQLVTLVKALMWCASATTWWRTCSRKNKQMLRIIRTKRNKEKALTLNQTYLVQRIIITIEIQSWISLIAMILDSWITSQVKSKRRKSTFTTTKETPAISRQTVRSNLKVTLITMITI